MNYLDKCIKTRKSVRNFTDKKVSNNIINKIIKAGVQAPSGGNFQPWYFIVTQKEETIKEIKRIIFEKNFQNLGFKKNISSPLFNAKTIISVCVDMSKTYLNSSCKNDLDRVLDSVEIISVGACIENMLLKINDLGLGACWCRVSYYYRKSLENLLEIKSPYFLIANIALGYPAEKVKATSRKKMNLIYKIIE